MRNEILWFIMMFINFLMVILAFKFFKKTGLYVLIPISVILANLQTIVTLHLFGFIATLGNIVYGIGFLATDILSEEYGKKEADKGVYIGFFTLIVFTSLMFVCTRFNLIDNAGPFRTMYGIMPRIAIASLVAYLFSNKHDTWSFEFWKKRFPKHLWIRNNFSTIISQLIDTITFTIISFYGILTFKEMFELCIFTYILKVIVALCDTPFIYIIKKMANRNGKEQV
jgi:uncharacterized integral membrane protein (TIGR00697 family)